MKSTQFFNAVARQHCLETEKNTGEGKSESGGVRESERGRKRTIPSIFADTDRHNIKSRFHKQLQLPIVFSNKQTSNAAGSPTFINLLCICDCVCAAYLYLTPDTAIPR